MKKGLLVLFLVTIFAVSSLFANGLSLNSIGPRALGMGGAMVGLADDPTAIYWNPAGLAGQNSSLYFFATDIIPFGTYKNETYGIDAKTKTNHYLGPNLFANYNMGNLALGLGVFVPAGLGAEYNGDDLTPLSNGHSLEWKSKIAVIDIAPTIAYKINDMFSIGVTGNIFYGMFDMKKPSNYTKIDTSVSPPDTSYLSYQYSESSTGTGFGVSGGILCKLSERIQFGVSMRTEIKVKMSGEAENALINEQFGSPATSDFDRDVAWPLWAAFGVAVKPMENLTITADAQYSQWAKSEDTFKTEFKDATWAYVTGLSGDDTFVLDWKDCIQYRLGLEYMASEKFAVRAGYYYDPAPAPDETLNILFPSSTNNVVTAGLGFCVGKFDVDFGLEYLMGKERDVTLSTHNMPGKHKLDIFAFSLAIGMGLM